MNIQDYATRIAAIRDEVGRVLVGQEAIVEAVLVGVFARGHVLIEGAPAWARRCWCARSRTCSAARSSASSSRPT